MLKECIKKYFTKTVLIWEISLIIVMPIFQENLLHRIVLAILNFCTIFLVITVVNENIVKNFKIIKKRKSKNQDIIYEREVINDYSPLICAKLLGKDIVDADVVVAMILYLKEKQMIIIDDNGKLIINKKTEMLEHEKFFVEKSKFIFYDLYNKTKTKYASKYTIIQYLEKLTYKDMLKIGLIKDVDGITNKYEERDYVTLLEAMPLFYVMLNILFIASMSKVTNNISVMIIKTIILIGLLTNVVIHFIDKKYNFSFDVIKTEKADMYTMKLLAQERYLREYSEISSRSITEEILWENYIKMAIFFDMKGKLDKEAQEYYIKIIRAYGYIEKNESHIGIIIACVGLIGPWMLFMLMADGLLQLLLSHVVVWPQLFMYLYENKNKVLRK